MALTWTDPEWCDPKDGEYDQAFAASDDQFLVEAEITHNKDGWFWFVKTTSRLSEYPEVENAGPANSLGDAKAKAEAAVEKATAGVTPRTY